MIAFFAFNNTNVVTMLNLKMNYFGDEEAYLLVKGSPIISEELLNSIKDAKVFSGIYVLDVPRINMKEVRWKHIKGVRVFAKTQKINNYYQRILDSYFEGRIFDKVFIHGGWNDTIYLLNYCCRSNKKVEIDFVEEGTVTYSYTRKQLFNVRPGIKKRRPEL